MSTVSNKVRLIPSWAASIIVGLLSLYVPRLLDAIQSGALRTAATSLLNRAKEMIKAISDADPENEAQLNAIVRNFLSQDAVPLAEGVVTEKIALIGNERVRRGLTILSRPVVDSMRILTDENPDNAAQAEVVLDDFLLNPEAQEFIIADLVMPILEKRIPDPLIRSFLLEALATGIREGAEALAEQDTFNTNRVLDVINVAEKKAKLESKVLLAA